MSIIKKAFTKEERAKHDLRLEMKSSKYQTKFQFKVQRNRVEVECLNPHHSSPKGATEPDKNDWRSALSESEKLHVFSLILDEYRKHSIGDEHGYRGAVLGVSTTGQIFLGANTATGQIASPYFKECAEQNMVSAASDLVAYQQVKKFGWNKFKLPQAPQFDSVYMMGGVDQSKVPVSCPCGKCTDMLAKNMVDGGKVYALPILNKPTFEYLKESPSVDITINRSATLADVRARVTQPPDAKQQVQLTPYPVWQTSIRHLNAYREISLDDDKQLIANSQRTAYALLCKEMKDLSSLHENAAAARHQEALKQLKKTDASIQSPWNLFTHVVQHAKLLGSELLKILGASGNDAVAYAAANQFLGRKSIAQLDAASPAGKPDIVAVNAFMRAEIRHIGADRITHDPQAKNIWTKTIAKNIPHIRCVVMQLDDGTFHYATECAGAYDASLPNAEAVAVANALPALGNAGIRDVWVMEANADAIERGVLPTSPKEGVERIVKRAAKQGVNFHYIPLNDGTLNAQTLEAMTAHLSQEKLFPALFQGSRPLEPKKEGGKRAWSTFLAKRLEPAVGAMR
jgi:hypothetical protein